MISVSAYLQVYGAQFSPKKAQAALAYRLEDPVEPGVSARNENQAVKGSASFSFEWDSGSEPGFEDGVADLLPASLPIFRDEGLIKSLRACGADEFILYVGVNFLEQCNMELSPRLLGALAELGVVLAISCYPGDDSAKEA